MQQTCSMCTGTGFPFPQTVATKQTGVTSLTVLWIDVLVEIDDLGVERGG